MPYGTRKSGNQYENYNKHTGKTYGKVRSKAVAKRQLMAIHANTDEDTEEKDMPTVDNPALQRIMGRKPIQPLLSGDQGIPSPVIETPTLHDFIQEAVAEQGGSFVEVEKNVPAQLVAEPGSDTNQEQTEETEETAPVPVKSTPKQPVQVKEPPKKVKKGAPTPRVAAPGRPVVSKTSSVTKAYISPRPPSLLDRFRAKRPMGISIFKGADGLRHMMIVATNSYRDREDEYITTQALKEYVEKSWVAEDQCVTNNGLRFWHSIDNIGTVEWCDMEGPFLLEVAKELPNKWVNLAKIDRSTGKPGKPVYCMVKDVWNYIEKNPDDIDWGSSHGYDFYKNSRYKNERVYDNILKFETSTLPIKWASNPYTLSGVIDMAPRDKILDKITGVSGASSKAKSLRKGANALEKLLTERGVQHKEFGGIEQYINTGKKQKSTVEKALMQDLELATRGFLSQITNDMGQVEALLPSFMNTIVTNMVGTMGQQTAAPGAGDPMDEPIGADEDPVPDDFKEEVDNSQALDKQNAADNAEQGGPGEDGDGEDYGYDDQPDEKKKSLELFDTLIEAQEYITDKLDEIESKLKGFDESEEDNEESDLDVLLKKVERIEKQLNLRPKSAASQDEETIVEDGDLLSRVKAAMANYDDFWGSAVTEG